MEVYKRKGSPSWCVDLVHPVTGDRVRRSLRFEGSKVAAQKRARQLEAELEREAELSAGGRLPITVSDAVDRYITALEAHRQPSATNQRYRAERLFGRSEKAEGLWCLSPKTWLHDLTPALMEQLVLARKREGKSAQTIKHELGLLSATARYVVGLNYRGPEAILQSGVKNPWRTPQVKQKTRYLSPEEYQLVYDYLDPDRPVTNRWGHSYKLPSHLWQGRHEARELLVALAYTGGRWSEVAGLTWDRVDFDRGTIRLYGSKSGGKDRLVPMADVLRTVLKQRLAVRVGNAKLVFPTRTGGLRAAPSDAIGEAMSAVGLNDEATVAKHGTASVHSLRHTFASWLIQNGADLADVKEALGHSSVVVTTRYAHLQKGKLMDKLGSILNGVTPDPRHTDGTPSLADCAEPCRQPDVGG